MKKALKVVQEATYLEVPSLAELEVAPPPTIDLEEIANESRGAVEAQKILDMVEGVAPQDRLYENEDGIWVLEYHGWCVTFGKEKPYLDDVRAWKARIDIGTFQKWDMDQHRSVEVPIAEAAVMPDTKCACGKFGRCEPVLLTPL